jgi:hypothetical protein
MSVIKHDFGLNKRRAARRLRSMLDLDALHEANVERNPLPYLERASERIYQLEKLLFEAADAAKLRRGEAHSAETIEVDKAEYEALLLCRSTIESGVAQLGDDDEPGAP